MQSVILEEKATYFRQVLAPPLVWGPTILWPRGFETRELIEVQATIVSEAQSAFEGELTYFGLGGRRKTETFPGSIERWVGNNDQKKGGGLQQPKVRFRSFSVGLQLRVRLIGP